jgi:hypothetical protein
VIAPFGAHQRTRMQVAATSPQVWRPGHARA